MVNTIDIKSANHWELEKEKKLALLYVNPDQSFSGWKLPLVAISGVLAAPEPIYLFSKVKT